MTAGSTRAALAAALAVAVAACGGRGGSGGANAVDERPIAVLSAFPAEMRAVLRRTVVEDVEVANGFGLRSGSIAGRRVIVSMTGIGPVNAAAATRALLDRHDVAGIVVSGVAGSSLRIGDIAVPDAWTLRGEGGVYPAHAPWLAVAKELEGANLAFERCTIVPDVSPDEPVCLAFEPAVSVGGGGETEDPFGGRAFQCFANDDDVFGCDDAVVSAGAAAVSPGGAESAAESFDYPFAVDQETAAIAREAAARGVPFIAFRAVSDGEGDPLDLPGFPTQFFAYYRLAAENAATAAAAFLERLP
jgi:nucleoside phosphorylase